MKHDQGNAEATRGALRPACVMSFDPAVLSITVGCFCGSFLFMRWSLIVMTVISMAITTHLLVPCQWLRLQTMFQRSEN